MERVSLTVGDADSGQRLDRFCARRLEGFSRTQIQALNAAGGIVVDGRVRADSFALSAGELITVDPSRLEGRRPAPPAPQEIPVAVAYEDDDVVVVNKAAGLVVHPAHGHWEGTLVNALIGRGTRLAPLGGGQRPGVVHRLDKDTSGLMVLAKTDAAYRGLVAAFKQQAIEKTYHAIVRGHVRSRSIRIDEPIARHPVHRQKMAVRKASGRSALTAVLVVDTYGHFDYIRVNTHTGRTHQIRVHMAHVGNPLLGDAVYGGRKPVPVTQAKVRAMCERLLKLMPRHALHASRLSFVHPVSGRRLAFTAALPADMRLALETLHREDRAQEVAA
jgi:23S rRNA pseudouridine1911/1915/1917 synthase